MSRSRVLSMKLYAVSKLRFVIISSNVYREVATYLFWVAQSRVNVSVALSRNIPILSHNGCHIPYLGRAQSRNIPYLGRAQSRNIPYLGRAKSHEISSVAQIRNIPILSRNGRNIPDLGRNIPILSRNGRNISPRPRPEVT